MSNQQPNPITLEARVEHLEDLVEALASHFVATHEPTHPDPGIHQLENRIEHLGEALFNARRAKR
jgi:hypothetical protein